MELFIHFLHYNLTLICELMAILVEIWGTVLLAIAIYKEIISNIDKKFDFSHILGDSDLNHGLSTVLEIYLASEILKTVYASSLDSLMSIAVLVLLRVSMSVALHWEGKQKGHIRAHNEKSEKTEEKLTNSEEKE